MVLGRCDEGPWIKAHAVADALRKTNAEILIVADADVWATGLPEALQAVCDGASWAIPHRGVLRLSEGATARYLAGGGERPSPGAPRPPYGACATSMVAGAEYQNETGRPRGDGPVSGPRGGGDPLQGYHGHAFRGDELIEPPYLGTEGGGIVVLRRELYEACPLDPRFVGWGSEDDSWGMALRTLHGPPLRIRQPLVHLYHPPQPRATRSWGSVEGRTLRKRYARASGNPSAMRSLIEEAHDALRTTEPPDDARASQRRRGD